jgi:hypothetical protein
MTYRRRRNRRHGLNSRQALRCIRPDLAARYGNATPLEAKRMCPQKVGREGGCATFSFPTETTAKPLGLPADSGPARGDEGSSQR